MMEVTKVLTSVFVLCLSGPTFGYPFTHSNLFSANGANGPRGAAAGQGGAAAAAQPQQLPTHLEDYLAAAAANSRGGQPQPAHLEDYMANYVQGRQYPQYQPAYQQQGYLAQAQPQPKLTAETLAALLPYLSSSSSSLAGVSSDYVYPDYPAAAPTYTDDDGTWYDDMAGASQQLYGNEPSQQEDEQLVLQLLLDHLNGRYSLDDLAALEREAEMEENTESQLQSLMSKKVRRHEIMNDFGQGDEQHLTIRRLRENVGDNHSEQEKDVGHNVEEEEHKDHESDARGNTHRANSQDTSATGSSSQDDHYMSSAAGVSHRTGLRKRSWGQTIGHLSFWGPNRYRSHRAHKGDVGHINFFSPL